MSDCLLCLARRRFLAGAGAMAGLSLLPGHGGWGARPEIANVALGDLDWAALGARNRRKQLSLDPDTGAQTFYLDIPANWQGGGVAHYHSCSEEVYVISGDVTLNGRDYLKTGAYLYRPARIVHGHQEGSVGGGQMIIKTDSTLDFNYIPEPTSDEEYVFSPSKDGRPHILHLKTPELEWSWHGDGKGKYGVKVLSEDRDTGASTSLVRLPAGWAGEFDMSADASWEWFVLDGEAALNDGTTLTGESYSVRPAGGEGQALVRAATQTHLLLWRD